MSAKDPLLQLLTELGHGPDAASWSGLQSALRSRHRRIRFRKISTVAGCVILLLMVPTIVLIWKDQTAGVERVISSPLPVVARIVSRPNSFLRVDSDESRPVTVVRTSGRVERLSDERLLAIFQDRSPALIQGENGREKLILGNP